MIDEQPRIPTVISHLLAAIVVALLLAAGGPSLSDKLLQEEGHSAEILAKDTCVRAYADLQHKTPTGWSNATDGMHSSIHRHSSILRQPTGYTSQSPCDAQAYQCCSRMRELLRPKQW